MKIKRLALTGCLSSLALIIFVLEGYLPVVPIPGVKLGLSNIILLITLKAVGRKEAFFVLLIKTVLGSLFSGTPISFIFSICGGLCALGAIFVLEKPLGDRFLWVASVFGAVFHNFGQLVAAFFVMETGAVFSYTPYLVISAVITGAFTGVAASAAIKIIRKAVKAEKS